MNKFSIHILLVLLALAILSSCSSKSSSSNEKSIEGTYIYQDAVSRSSVSISGDTWRMKTQFGAPGYYGSDAKYDSGKVKGNVLYYSGLFKYGVVSGNTLDIGGRIYRKQ